MQNDFIWRRVFLFLFFFLWRQTATRNMQRFYINWVWIAYVCVCLCVCVLKRVGSRRKRLCHIRFRLNGYNFFFRLWPISACVCDLVRSEGAAPATAALQAAVATSCCCCCCCNLSLLMAHCIISAAAVAIATTKPGLHYTSSIPLISFLPTLSLPLSHCLSYTITSSSSAQQSHIF